MKPDFIDILERKLFMAERRLRIEQKNIWLYKSILDELGIKPKKTQQLDLLTGT